MLNTNAKLGMTAVSLELSAMALLLLSSHNTWVLYQYFALHAMASAAITPVAWAVLPQAYKQPRIWVMKRKERNKKDRRKERKEKKEKKQKKTKKK